MGIIFYCLISIFYYNIYKKNDIVTHLNSKTEYLLYLINPPKLRFAYSLCILKDKFEIIQEIKTFDNSKAWDTFDIDKTLLKTGEWFAFRLTIDDDINKQSIEMYKRLK